MTRETRPLYWSIRRELWENRSIYMAPLAGIAIVLASFLFATIRLPQRVRGLGAHNLDKQFEIVTMPFGAAAGITVVISFVVAFFYCLDALYADRSDRSILFWKSLPVSDRTTVLAKAAIPLVVMPVITLGIILVAQLFMLITSAAVLVRSGAGLATFWARLPIFQMTVALLYSLVAVALWHAPIYAWLLLVSGWAKRATFLWAVAPLFAAGVFERMALGTSHIAKFAKFRVVGWFTQSFVITTPDPNPGHPLSTMTPGRFFSTPGLWIGLVLAAVCLAAAVRMRRDREPI